MARRLVLLLTFVGIGLIAGLVLTGRMRTAEESTAAAPPAPTVQTPRDAASAPGALPDLTTAAQRAIGSVTNISSTQIVRTPNSPFANDPFFQYFFGDSPFGYSARRAQSLGSGVVVSPDGYVLTNNHVIGDDPRAQVSVVLADKRELRARIVGVDRATDLALLKVDATGLPTLPWGDSSQLKIAEWVLAIGNPFGVLSQTVTLGIVSATGRSLEGRLATYEDFIQTDAAINRGNSGGALINARGQLVGINTAIFSETGGYQGIGFAVPSNLARHVMEQLKEHGQVRRGTITGIELYPLTSRLAEELGSPSARGVIVYSVMERSPAYAGGLRAGDIIVSFNDTPVDDSQHFMRLLSDAPIGSTVTLGLLRDGRSASAKVPIVEATGRTRARR
ncbi:MAG TPA: trypsin-like peptidase domain-containing protein [Vicinamibacterales bacterium]|nr:trypsin-like peptidase domain-containing protein [Vicinamibacterales bacterium]